MPDQYMLDWVCRREVTRRRPVFVRYLLISTHVAFNIQLPFIPDWDRIGDGTIYKNLPSVCNPIC